MGDTSMRLNCGVCGPALSITGTAKAASGSVPKEPQALRVVWRNQQFGRPVRVRGCIAGVVRSVTRSTLERHRGGAAVSCDRWHLNHVPSHHTPARCAGRGNGADGSRIRREAPVVVVAFEEQPAHNQDHTGSGHRSNRPPRVPRCGCRLLRGDTRPYPSQVPHRRLDA
jgi:hypothetical protein